MEEFNVDVSCIFIGLLTLLFIIIYVFYTPSTNSFPRLIHQSYKTEQIEDPLWLECQKSWLTHNPFYEYKFWTDSNNEKLIRDNDPEFLTSYLSYNHFIKRADAARYYYMYHYGGIYADLDFKCLKPFNDILDDEYDVILGRMGQDESFEDSIPNALMISKPKCDFWLYVISVMKKRVNATKSPEYDTGPRLLKYCVDTYKGTTRIKILPSRYLYPINWNNDEGQNKRKHIINNNNIDNEFKGAYAVTYWGHSW